MSFVLKLTVDQISEKILFQSPQQKHLIQMNILSPFVKSKWNILG